MENTAQGGKTQSFQLLSWHSMYKFLIFILLIYQIIRAFDVYHGKRLCF